MWNRRLRLTGLAILILLVGPANRGDAGVIRAGAACNDGSASFHWDFFEDPQSPTGHPEWVGYDVLRRSLTECGGYVTVNAQPFPRVQGESQSFTYDEVPPATSTMFEYRIVCVDADRQPVQLDYAACEGCAFALGWASCPLHSAPLTVGTLEDWGWALSVHPSDPACYQSFYFDQSAVVEALRPYAGTDATIRFYGDGGCGTVEGCAMRVDRYEVANGPTPVRAASWGRLKTIYR